MSIGCTHGSTHRDSQWHILANALGVLGVEFSGGIETFGLGSFRHWVLGHLGISAMKGVGLWTTQNYLQIYLESGTETSKLPEICCSWT